jgi:hypothetical protein
MIKSILKWVAISVVGILALSGCEYDDDDVVIGYPSVIKSVELYEANNIGKSEDDFDIGDTMTYRVVATDSEGDMEELWVTHYYPNDSKTIHQGPDLDVLPANSGTILEFSSDKRYSIEAPTGSYRAEFKIIDKMNNESIPFVVYYHIH